MNMLIKETFINNNTFFRLFTFHRRGITCSSKSSRKYAPMPATEVMQYGPPNWALTFPTLGSSQCPELFSTPSH